MRGCDRFGKSVSANSLGALGQTLDYYHYSMAGWTTFACEI